MLEPILWTSWDSCSLAKGLKRFGAGRKGPRNGAYLAYVDANVLFDTPT